MKGKTLLIRLLAAGLLAALAFLRFGDKADTAGPKMGGKLFADLPVNQVTSVTFADADNQTTLFKGDTVWQVEERNGYPANFDELRDTVVKLSRLKIGRSFSASPESLVRLSLMAPSASDASARGKQITLKDASGKILADVILGQTRRTEDGGNGGQYLKKTDGDSIYLADGDFQFLKTEPAQWLQKEMLNVKGDEVESVACYAGDNQEPIYTLARPKKGQDARMTPLPQARTADPAKVDQVLDALAPLTLDDVQAASQPPAMTPDRQRLVYRLYDGRQISIFPGFDGKDSYTLRITAQETGEQTAETAEHAATAEDDDGEPQNGQTDGESASPGPQTVQQINEALSPWVFSIKKWQFDSFITQPESLLEEVKKEGEGTS